jgi:hypothetical protein
LRPSAFQRGPRLSGSELISTARSTSDGGVISQSPFTQR